MLPTCHYVGMTIRYAGPMSETRVLVFGLLLPVVALGQQETPFLTTLAGKVIGAGRELPQITLYHNDLRGGSVEPVAGAVGKRGGAFEMPDVKWFEGADWHWNRVILLARIDGHVGMLAVGRDVDAKALTIELRPTRKLRGVVRDEVTGRPIPNAWVWPMIFGRSGAGEKIVWPTAPMMPWGARTDASGKYVLTGLPVYSGYLLDVSGSNHARRLVRVAAADNVVATKLSRAAGVTGSVSLANGEPAAHYPVWINGGEAFARTKTDAEGRFVFGSLAAEAFRVQAMAPHGWGMTIQQTGVEVRAGEVTTGVHLQFMKCGFVVGRLVDKATGKPMMNSVAFVSTMGVARDNRFGTSSVRVDPDGSFRLCAPPGPNDLTVNWIGAGSDRQRVHVVAGEEVELARRVSKPKLRD